MRRHFNHNALKYIKHLLLILSTNYSAFPAQYVTPQTMPSLREMTIEVRGEIKDEVNTLLGGIREYESPIVLNLYLKVSEKSRQLPFLRDSANTKTLLVKSLTLRFQSYFYMEEVIEPLKHLTSVEFLSVSCSWSTRGIHPEALTPLSAISFAVNELTQLRRLELAIPSGVNTWQIPPSVEYLRARVQMFRNIPPNSQIYDSVTSLDLTLKDPTETEGDLDIPAPFTNLESLIVYTTKDSAPFIRRLIASNPRLTNLALCSLDPSDEIEVSEYFPIADSIENLEFYGHHLKMESIITRPHPNLQTLSLCQFSKASIDFDQLKWAVSPQGTCPKLKSIYGHLTTPVRSQDDCLTIFMNSERFKNLKNFSFTVRPFITSISIVSHIFIDAYAIRQAYQA